MDLFEDLYSSVNPSINAFQSAVRPSSVVSTDITFKLMRTAKSKDVDQNLKVAQLDGIAAAVDSHMQV